MAVDLESIVKQLTDSGIIAPGKLENFVPPKAAPKDVDELVKELVKQGHLTQFQAQQVKAGKSKSLIMGEYTILDKIGAGGMGQVFKAVHRRMDRTVAIKMLPPSMTKDAAAAARFEREVRAAAKLSHPNIVHANDAGQVGNVHFLVMEYVEGKDLSVLVKQNGPLPINKAVNYILQAARGLEFAHSKGVIHRDIKPANLLLGTDGTVKILDMGLARIENDGPAQTELTGTGTIMGTVDYMAPEQAINTKYADHRADIYSLGISLYYLLAGKAAYSGETAMEKLMAHQNQPIPSLQDVQTTVPKQLDAVYKKLVAKKIEDRYQSMSEVIEALEALGYSGSVTINKGEVASTLALSSADRQKLAIKPKAKPLGSLTDVVASEKTKYFFAKIVGGTFATIIAPILGTYLIKHLDKKDEPPHPPIATAPATVPPIVVATNTTTQPPAPVTSPAASLPNQPWNTPAFQAWMKEVQGMPAEEQIKVVSKKLVELNPGFDGELSNLQESGEPNIVTGVVREVSIEISAVNDLSPLRAFAGIQSLRIVGPKNKKSMNLSALQGMPLQKVHLSGPWLQTADVSALQGCPSLQLVRAENSGLNAGGSKRLEQALPDCKVEWVKRDMQATNQPWNTPAFQTWMKEVQAMPAEEQIEAVSKKLVELNPGFDGKVTHKIEGQFIKSVEFASDKIADVSPVRALVGLQALICSSTPGARSGLADLSPLQGMRLSELLVQRTNVSDLSPLRGMPLTYLNCYFTLVSDLSPLQVNSLTRLAIPGTKVSDLNGTRAACK